MVVDGDLYFVFDLAKIEARRRDHLSSKAAGSRLARLKNMAITTAIDALAEDGTALSGEVVIDETVDLVYTDFSSCSGSSGDYDLDGDLDAYILRRVRDKGE